MQINSQLQSKLLCKLIKQTMKDDHSQSLNSFWEEIKRLGTPLVEPDPNNASDVLLSFLWRSSKDIHNVVLGFYSMLKKQMTHIVDTDIWYTTLSVHKNTRTIYCVSPNDSLLFVHEHDLFESNWTNFSTSWQADPLNPHSYRIPSYLTRSGKEMIYSLIDLTPQNKSTWSSDKSEVAMGKIEEHLLISQVLNNQRQIHVYSPPPNDNANKKLPHLLIVLDGNAYLDMIHTPAILDNLIAAKKIPPTIAVFISNPKPNIKTRSLELPCYPPFAEFLSKEMIAWIRDRYEVTNDPSEITIAGSSFGGLAAAYSGLCHPEIFGNILCQSGAFWWYPKNYSQTGWLIHQYLNKPTLPLRFYLDCGLMENFPICRTGDSTLSSNRYMRDALISKNYKVFYSEFAGGHDYICWKETLADGLIALSKKKEALKA